MAGIYLQSADSPLSANIVRVRVRYDFLTDAARCHFGKKVPKDTWSPKRHHLTQKWPLRHQIDQKIVKITNCSKKGKKVTKIINPKKSYQLAHHPNEIGEGANLA
jgi:hypothetical protein